MKEHIEVEDDRNSDTGKQYRAELCDKCGVSLGEDDVTFNEGTDREEHKDCGGNIRVGIGQTRAELMADIKKFREENIKAKP